MKEFSQISDDEKWQAIVYCDKKYDGIFFYGVKTTEIFCKPSCKSKNPARTNAIFFENLADGLHRHSQGWLSKPNAINLRLSGSACSSGGNPEVSRVSSYAERSGPV